MTRKIIPIFQQHLNAVNNDFMVADNSLTYPLIDKLGRELRDLRISVTDRCNFRCVYCMPRAIFDKNYPYLPHSDLLTFEEITRLAKMLVAQGVNKIRLTGGEPLLRKDIERLVAMLKTITTPDGKPVELTMTTNGALLAQKAQALKDAGLDRVTVSLDSLDEAIFKELNDIDFPVADVLNGIDQAYRVGLGPIKINMVVKASANRSQIIPMAQHFKNTPYILRFIEYMDVGTSNGWKMEEVVPSREIIQMLNQSGSNMNLAPVSANYRGETAKRWRYLDGTGEIGVVSSVTEAFCGDCSRLRLSTEGKLYTCLFATQGYNLRALVRGGANDQQIHAKLASVWRQREDRYSEIRSSVDPMLEKVEMSYIGG